MDRQENVIGGLSREFFERVGKHYGQPISWLFEPSVAERILNDWLKEAGVQVIFNQRLAAADKRAGRIVRLRTTAGEEFEASVFIDSSYEGDLMKAAGVSYAVGRDSRSLYGESLAGTAGFPAGQSPAPRRGPGARRGWQAASVRPAAGNARGHRRGRPQISVVLLPHLSHPESVKPPAAAAARRVRPGAIRTRARVSEGAGRFRAAGRFHGHFAAAERQNGYQQRRRRIDESARRELGVSRGELRTPAGDLARASDVGARAALFSRPTIPRSRERLRAEMNQWGLAKDEFPDTGHWPHQLYVREGRRMLGEYVLTQHDLQENRHKEDSIGMGGYNIDIREVQWVAHDVYHFPAVRKEVFMEGYLSHARGAVRHPLSRAAPEARPVRKPAGHKLHLRVEHRLRFVPDGAAVHDRRACRRRRGGAGGQVEYAAAPDRPPAPAGGVAAAETDRYAPVSVRFQTGQMSGRGTSRSRRFFETDILSGFARNQS